MPTTAADIGNVFNCAIAAQKGTGDKHCAFKEKTPRKPIYSKRGFDWGTITDLTDAGIAKEIQRGNIHILPYAFGFERVTEENVRETSALGNSSLARKGLYKYRFMWDKDDRLQEVLSSYDSSDRFDYVMVDSQGNMKLTKSGNKITGASVGLIDTDPFMEATGSEASKVAQFIELNNPDDYNQHAVYFAAANLPSRILKLEGINEIVLKLTSFAAGASRTIKFDAFLKDGTTAFQGGVTADFRLLFNGTAGAGTITEDSPGKYTYTEAVALAAGDEIKLSTWDATESTTAIIKDVSTVYRGAEVTAVVA